MWFSQWMGPLVDLLLKTNKEASWLYAELKSHILFQVSFVAYLKLSDETWNEMCYLKLLQIETFQNHHEGCLFETFRWDLKLDVLFETFANWNFSKPSWGLLIWNFQMRLEMRCAIWNFMKHLKLETLEMRCAIWTLKLLKQDMVFETFETFWNLLKFFKPIIGGNLKFLVIKFNQF